MVATKNSYHPEMPLNQWSDMFKAIYFPTQNYGRSTTQIFTHLVKVFGGGSHYLFRNYDPTGARDFLAKTFGWYCALANKLQLDLEETIWRKYPGACPRCLERVCACHATPKEIDFEKLSEISAFRSHERPTTLRQWQMMFGNLYRGPSGGENVPLTRERVALIFSRIAEELGEVAEAILLDRTIDKEVDLVVQNEMADLGAWIFALANNLQYVDSSASGTMLADVTWSLYGGKCHRCKEIPCICVPGDYSLELAEKGAMGPSHWDERTGLANYKAYGRFIASATTKFRQQNGFWSIISFDLDDFGRVNKDHGNAVGDAVLWEVASRMKRVVAENGIPFRRGGEEFVIVLETTLDNALVVAERIRREIAATPIHVKSSNRDIELPMTASFGVASTNIDGKPPDQLEALSDERARDAKKAGKNKVLPELRQDLKDLISKRRGNA